MSDREIQLDAAEYVIGTMTPVERRVFDALVETNEQAREDVAFWERSFGALNETVAPEAPGKHVWKRIEQALREETRDTAEPAAAAPVAVPGATASAIAAERAANDNRLDKLKRSRGRWRGFSLMAAALIGAMAAWIYYQPQPVEQRVADSDSAREFVAVVNADGDKPSLLVNVNTATGNVTVRSLGIERPEGKSLELWYVPQGQRPVSVGLVDDGKIDLSKVEVTNGDLLAVSLEPEGGSPTGQATGPVIYTGKLVSADPQ